MNKLLTLSFILILGFILRVVFINDSPPSIYGDEATIILDAYSLLKTGYDQLGNSMPLTFPMGAGRPAGFVYAAVPFIALFGSTALGVRFLSILSGIGIIISLYYIGKRLFSYKLGLIASFISAVSIWDISLSRGGFEAHFALFLALLGFLLFLKSKENPFLYFFSALSFGLTLHTYPTYKLSLLLFLPLLFWFTKTHILGEKKKYILGFFVILFIWGGLALSQTFIGGSETRFANINIFSQDKLKVDIEEKINLERSLSRLPSFLRRYFHNKPVEYTKILGENYIQNFSVDFLFIHGDRNPRHNMATMGQLYFVELLLVCIGLLSLWQKERNKLILLLGWLLIAPIPTALVDLPHALRSSFMLPPLILFSAMGLSRILNFQNKVVLYLTIFIFLIQFAFFLQKLYFLAPNEYAHFWSFSAKLASEVAIKERNLYDAIILSDKIDSIEFVYPVYAKISPQEIIQQNKFKTSINGYTFKRFGNVYIGSIYRSKLEDFLSQLPGKTLYIGDLNDIDYLKDSDTQGPNSMNTIVISKRSN